MSVKVTSQSAINFGTLTNGATVTHIRFRRASDNSAPVVHPLDSAITVGAGRILSIPSGEFSVTYPNGDLTNDHMEALVRGYWNNTAMEIDAMTSGTNVVTDAGYSQASYSNWGFTRV